jgi:hypothetical protein
MLCRNAASDIKPAVVLLLTVPAVLQQQRGGPHWREADAQKLLGIDVLAIRGAASSNFGAMLHSEASRDRSHG